MLALFVGIFGLIIGSFLNVCIFRIPREESIAYPPSHCTKCGTSIKSYDLIPVVSYLLIKGKCRKCGDKISLRYPFIELFTGSIFILLYLRFGLNIELVKFAALSCFLIVIGIIDFDTTDIYNCTVIPAIVLGILFIGVDIMKHEEFATYLYGGILAGGVIAAIILLTKGMGWGDFDLCLLCGLFLGFKLSIIMLFFSFVIGGFFGIYLILSKKKSRKDQLPFGPFIVIATFIAIFLGNSIINWYLNIIL